VKAPQLTAALLLAAAFVFLPPVTAAQDDSDSGTDLQLIRISYMQGDVRFNRGSNYEPDLKRPWEQAQTNMPIEQGFALATGDGRAEIEFEHGSVIYLAENSVLLFGVATEKKDMLETRLELVCGTATTAVRAYPHEIFEIDTPTSVFDVHSPKASYVRIDSFLDGASITPQADPGFDFGHGDATRVHADKGETVTYEVGLPMRVDKPDPSKPRSEFDEWVETRYTARSLEMKAALKAAGLALPILGLIDMYEGGKFSPCPPYGTCWEPNSILPPDVQTAPQPPSADDSGDAFALAPGVMLASYSDPRAATPQVRASANDSPPQAAAQSSPSQTTAAPFQPTTVPFLALESWCPFPRWTTINVRANSPRDRDTLLQQSYAWQLSQGWSLPVCHFGQWVHHRHYRVVLHHHRCPPAHWVKVGNRTGFVPAHPADEKGKPPVNLKNGFYAIQPGKSAGIIQHAEHVSFDPKTEKAEEIEAPKSVRTAALPAFAKAEPPEISARMLAAPLHDAKSGEAANTLKATYDYSKGQFLTAGSAPGRTAKPVAVASLNSHGALTRGTNGRSFSSGGEGGRGGGFSSGRSGGFSDGSHGAGGASGGGGRGGGSSGGGGSHGSEGGGSGGGGSSGGGSSGGGRGGHGG
jgi:hypothetical protein